MRSLFRVFIAAVSVALLGAAWLIYRMLRQRGAANEIMADMVDAQAAVRIRAQHEHIEQLVHKLGEAHVVVDGARAKLAEERQTLSRRYQALDLSPDEMDRRFSRLRI